MVASANRQLCKKLPSERAQMPYVTSDSAYRDGGDERWKP